ncbi:aminotransferase-like domain-containing protein [Pedobacter kyonggii]|uniref:PLP-dependent aminotransferase family protein n=1 Tax=Pedobacter kyonggii TaxID=1926871 RepID=A0A4Q9HH23_9SPHI|nr:PLP-dependent aminotransferase family protein [Pedobacter kyonggii]TBO44415.1 PLP-dependent aminotransferase family protein [Pedobacter kyonggii]
MDYLWRPETKNTVVHMLPFETLIVIDKMLSRPAYMQVVDGVIKLIKDGVIQKGDQMPGTRSMAGMAKIHRKTVIAAYSELIAQGWLVAVAKHGHYIARELPKGGIKQWGVPANGYVSGSKLKSTFLKIETTKEFHPHSFALNPSLIIDDGHPDSRLAPMHLLNREYLRRLKQQHVSKKPAITLAPGSLKLRETMTSYLAQTRGIQADLPNILITHGAQMSIYIAASLLLQRGSYIIVGEPGYHVANYVFEYLGANIIRIPADRDGIDDELIRDACEKYTISALYLIPHHHYPTTVTLSPERRSSILNIAEQYDFSIIEDDYDYGFQYDSSPYLPLASIHPDRVIYVGSFSKSLSTSIRIGFMVAASDFIEQAIYLRKIIELKGDNIMEDSLAALIESGDLGRHLKKVNKIFGHRRDYLCASLDEKLKDVVSFAKPEGGLALWTIFNNEYPLKNISLKASKMGLFINDGQIFDNFNARYNALRFGFASINETEIDNITGIIVRCL